MCLVVLGACKKSLPERVSDLLAGGLSAVDRITVCGGASCWAAGAYQHASAKELCAAGLREVPHGCQVGVYKQILAGKVDIQPRGTEPAMIADVPVRADVLVSVARPVAAPPVGGCAGGSGRKDVSDHDGSGDGGSDHGSGDSIESLIGALASELGKKGDDDDGDSSTSSPKPLPAEEPTRMPAEEPTPLPAEEPTRMPAEEPTPLPAEEPPPPHPEPRPRPDPVPLPLPAPDDVADLDASMARFRTARWRDTFTLTPIKPGSKCRHGGYQARCPYHALNEKTGCKKRLACAGPGRQNMLATLRALLWWCARGPDFQRQRSHVGEPVRADCTPPYGVIKARALPSVPEVVLNDDVLDRMAATGASGSTAAPSAIAVTPPEVPPPAGGAKGRSRGGAARGRSGRGRGRSRGGATASDRPVPGTPPRASDSSSSSTSSSCSSTSTSTSSSCSSANSSPSSESD